MYHTEETPYVRGLIDDKCDPDLGQKVREHLVTMGLENNIQDNYDPQDAVGALQDGVRFAFNSLGIPVDDPSTQDTPKRFACMVVGELTKGLNYDNFPKCTATPNGQEVVNGFSRSAGGYTEKETVGAYNQMVLVRDIQTISLCEHHLQTIDGVTHVAYIPRDKVLGLSKFARVTDFFARRPQIQERMTDQIYEALRFILGTDDIAVVVSATHFCMRARGALQSQATTQTDRMGGRFMAKPELRAEFMNSIRGTK